MWSRAVWKSTSENLVSLHAIEQTQLRRKYRVDGVGRPSLISTQEYADSCMLCEVDYDAPPIYSSDDEASSSVQAMPREVRTAR